jgi:hypothetical protein
MWNWIQLLVHGVGVVNRLGWCYDGSHGDDGGEIKLYSILRYQDSILPGGRREYLYDT